MSGVQRRPPRAPPVEVVGAAAARSPQPVMTDLRGEEELVEMGWRADLPALPDNVRLSGGGRVTCRISAAVRSAVTCDLANLGSPESREEGGAGDTVVRSGNRSWDVFSLQGPEDEMRGLKSI